MFYELKRQIEYFLKNKIYMASLIIAAIADMGMRSRTLHLGLMMCVLGYILTMDWAYQSDGGHFM